MGGQSSAIAQELCKNWIDDNGVTHPGLYDENFPDMVRWAEKYPNAIPGVLTMVEPTKYRTAMFDAVRTLVPVGDIIFAPEDPRDDILMIPDGKTGVDVPRKLGRAEKESLIQLRLMVEEMCLIVRSRKKNTGRVFYGLPPEWARRVHDDRAYAMAMAVWGVKRAQETEELGEPKGLDYSKFYKDPSTRVITTTEEQSPFMSTISGAVYSHGKKKPQSPFQGPSPFTRK